jgi:hypothetical protein
MQMPSDDNWSTPLLDGTRNLDRRKAAATGQVVEIVPGFEVQFGKYVKTVPTYAAQIPFDYEVNTLEGRHFGRANTFLAVGQDGEMYPIDEGIFKSTYRLDE